MAKYQIEMDDGTKYAVDAADNATDDEVAAAVHAHHAQAANPSTLPTGTTNSFTGHVFDNAAAGGKALKDLATGNYEHMGSPMPTPKAEGLYDKLLNGLGDDASLGNIAKTVGQNVMLSTGPDAAQIGAAGVPQVSASDASGALLEKMGASAPGKALTAIGGIHPLYNLLGTAVGQYGLPEVAKLTGIHPDNLQLMATVAGTGLKEKAGELNDPIATVAGKAGSNIADTASLVRTGANARNADELNAAIGSMAQEGGASANAMRGGDVMFTPDATRRMAGAVRSTFSDPKNELFPDSHPVTSGAVQDFLTAAGNGPVRLNMLNNMRERLGNDPQGSDAAQAGILRSTLMNELGKMNEGDVLSGDPAALQHLGQFLNEWQQKSRFSDIAGMVGKAETAPNTADSLQRQFANFKNADDGQNMRPFEQNEQDLISKVGDQSRMDSVLKLAGSVGPGRNNKLIPGLMLGGIGAAGGWPLAAAVGAGGMMARYIRNNAVSGKAERVLQAIEGRDTSGTAPAAVPPAQTIIPPAPGGPPLLTGPNRPLLGVRKPEMVAGWDGQMRRQTFDEMGEADAGRRAAADVSASPDVVHAWEKNDANAQAPTTISSQLGQAVMGENRWRPMKSYTPEVAEPAGNGARMLTDAVLDPAESSANATKQAILDSFLGGKPMRGKGVDVNGLLKDRLAAAQENAAADNKPAQYSTVADAMRETLMRLK